MGSLPLYEGQKKKKKKKKKCSRTLSGIFASKAVAKTTGGIKLGGVSIATVQMSVNPVLYWFNEVQMLKGQTRDTIRRQN